MSGLTPICGDSVIRKNLRAQNSHPVSAEKPQESNQGAVKGAASSPPQASHASFTFFRRLSHNGNTGFPSLSLSALCPNVHLGKNSE
jgi:hypothetical protein